MQEGSISVDVVEAVARDKGVRPIDLPPLHETVDSDALERVVRTGRSSGGVLRVEFEFASRMVTIDGATVSVRSPEG